MHVRFAIELLRVAHTALLLDDARSPQDKTAAVGLHGTSDAADVEIIEYLTSAEIRFSDGMDSIRVE